MSSTLPEQVAPPSYQVTPVLDLDHEIIALAVTPDGDALVLGPGAAELGERYDLLDHLDFERATGKAGEVISYVTGDPAPRKILLVGVGEQRRTDFLRAGAALARAVRDRAEVVTTIAVADPEVALEPFVVGTTLGSFGFHWRSDGPPWRPVETITLAEVGDEQSAALAKTQAIARASWRARHLASVPSNLKNPPWLADEATSLAASAGLRVRVWDEQQLADDGFGGILAVGGGSATPPRLVRLDYTASPTAPTVALVGKGITFDTGGLDIKPASGMLAMKRDMTGGAVVLSVMAALAEVGCPVNVVGLVPLAENAVSGSAMRPGDVVTHYGGRTSEVTNTDAEGRLVLADGLAYAVAEVKPDVVVDVATLTGAIKVALGQTQGGYFANDEALAARLAEAADVSCEQLWRMPLAEEYEERLASKVADADNGASGPGSIMAALFLQHFTGGLPWAHLDLSSIGDLPADSYEYTAGPTGFGARVLLTWLSSPDPLEGVRP